MLETVNVSHYVSICERLDTNHLNFGLDGLTSPGDGGMGYGCHFLFKPACSYTAMGCRLFCNWQPVGSCWQLQRQADTTGLFGSFCTGAHLVTAHAAEQ